MAETRHYAPTSNLLRRVYFKLLNSTGDDAATGVTFATGDIQISTENAAGTVSSFTDIAAIGAVTEIGRGWYYFELSVAEMTNRAIMLDFNDQTVPKEWLLDGILFKTAKGGETGAFYNGLSF